MRTAKLWLLLIGVGLLTAARLAYAQGSALRADLLVDSGVGEARIPVWSLTGDLWVRPVGGTGSLLPGNRANILRFGDTRPLTWRLRAFAAPLSRPPSTSDVWVGGTGNWNNAALWSTGVPTSNSAVVIDNGNSSSSTVNLNINGVANSLVVNSGDTLNINGGDSLTVSGAITNSGMIAINSTGSSAITSNGLTNSGTLEATNGGTLVLQAAGSANSNTGTIEAASGSTLAFNGGVWTNSQTIQNNAGTLEFEGNTTINGGAVTQTAAGSLVLGTATINAPVTNSSTGTITVLNGDNASIGALTNPAGGQDDRERRSSHLDRLGHQCGCDGYQLDGERHLAGSGSQ